MAQLGHYETYTSEISNTHFKLLKHITNVTVTNVLHAACAKTSSILTIFLSVERTMIYAGHVVHLYFHARYGKVLKLAACVGLSSSCKEASAAVCFVGYLCSGFRLGISVQCVLRLECDVNYDETHFQ